MQISTLTDSIGAQIDGIDLSRPQSAETLNQIRGALAEHRVVRIPNQTLEPDAYIRFGRAFGEPIPHVLDYLRMPGHPEILVTTNAVNPDFGKRLYAGAFWHTDQSYEAVPAGATMLYAKSVPAQGGQTMIADMTAAYDALDGALKARLDGLVALHLYGNRDEGGDDDTISASPLLTDAHHDRIEWVRHPLVVSHPVTGRKALYAVSGTSRRIEGMAYADAMALLTELKEHATQDRFVYGHRYAVGDIFMWDTLQTLHKAGPTETATGPEDIRVMHRISVRAGEWAVH
jgi:taurine dioxygenase